MEQDFCPCKLTNCPRHGDCAACREHHRRKHNSLTHCEKLERKAMGKSDTIRRYEFWGLLIFVGIPLPGTGVWTGALIASMLNISIKRAMPPLVLGMGMATVIMCFFSYVLPWIVTQF